MSTAPLFTEIEASGPTQVPGFQATGVGCDIRNNGSGRLDLALIVADHPCAVAGTFTRNAVCAAPVRLCQEVLAGNHSVRAIVANSGNANACTGPEGMADARRMQALAAEALGVAASEVLVASTGRIGRRLPMDKVAAGIQAAQRDLGTGGAHGTKASEAILTSDSRPKRVTVRIATSKGAVTLAGIAKGAGMIQPNMATMLAFLVTDLAASAAELRTLLQAAVPSSFNAITVDGDMSTNDTVLLLANGASTVGLADVREAFAAALQHVCERLARMIVGDGERITKVVELRVTGAASTADAERVARAIGNSLLVKTSWFGSDPNWGRLLSSAGASGALLQEDTLTLSYVRPGAAPVLAFANSRGQDANLPQWKAIVSEREFGVHLDLGLGSGSYRLFSTDLTDGYVHYNKSE